MKDDGSTNDFVHVRLGGKGEEGRRGKKDTTHAMVVDGGRKVGQQVWLLLQNWWTDMQLVEVKYDYFEKCDGCLLFFTKNDVPRRVDSFESVYSRNSSPIAECNNLDKEEDPNSASHYGIKDRID